MSLLYRLRPATALALRPLHFRPLTAARSFRFAPARLGVSYGSNPPDSKLIDVDVDLDEARSRENMDDDVVNTGHEAGKMRDIQSDVLQGGKMPDGGKIPNYSGPSIAEKKLDRSVNADDADSVNFPSSDQLSNEESGEAVSDSKFHSYSQQSHAKQWEGYANDLFEKPDIKKSNTGDFDATQSEMSSDMGSDLVGGMWSGKSKSGKKKSIDKQGSSIFDEIDSKKFYSTRSRAQAPRFSDGVWREDDTVSSSSIPDSNLSDVVGNGMSKVAAKARKAKAGTEDLAESAKEMADSAKEMAKEGWDSVKQGAKKVKETVKDAAETLSTPVYDNSPAKEDLYPASDSGNARGVHIAASPEAAAERSGASMGEDVNALRKSILDGPQDMPQGVGKRAKDVSGKPMETGTRDS